MDRQLDMVTLEVIRHRVEEILAEMYHTIITVSGNPTLYEAGDHEEAICDLEGNTIIAGGGVTEWTTCLEEGVKYLTKHFKKDPGFKEGEQWLHNYSYGAAVHGMDVQTLSPVYYKGEHVAWVVTAGHQMDIGGACPSGYNVKGNDFFGEGLLMRGLRLAGEGGRINRDVEETIRGLVRTPDGTMLGLYAGIASNNIAKTRLIECFNRYGRDTMLAFFRQIQDYSEKLIKTRLRQIPDGRWHVDHYVESQVPGEKYLKVSITAIKKGEEVTLDFTGSSPQSTGAQNIAAVGAKSNAHCAWLALLCFDIPWSAGAWRPVKFVLPEGSIVNPVFPAATSTNTPAGAGYITISGTYEVLSTMLSCSSEALRREAMASADASGQWPIVYGPGHTDEYFTMQLMDGVCGGKGATCYSDGDNNWGNMWGPKVQICNVETNELHFPLLYLMRRESQDSGGPGRFRGGNGLYYAFLPYNKSRHYGLATTGMGSEARMGNGLAGGYPCANVQAGIIRNSKFFDLLAQYRLPQSLTELGEMEPCPRIGSLEQDRDDVFVVFTSGGGGYGDPLDREPEMVQNDVKLGDVSVEFAREAYGVVIDPETLEIDLEETNRRRQEIKAERLSLGKI
jgi:N-methylhydantoinase B